MDSLSPLAFATIILQTFLPPTQELWRAYKDSTEQLLSKVFRMDTASNDELFNPCAWAVLLWAHQVGSTLSGLFLYSNAECGAPGKSVQIGASPIAPVYFICETITLQEGL